jgi:hypothetical protein
MCEMVFLFLTHLVQAGQCFYFVLLIFPLVSYVYVFIYSLSHMVLWHILQLLDQKIKLAAPAVCAGSMGSPSLR